MVKIKIHRGSNQIGGTITEIYTENTHIFIDFGSELSPEPSNLDDTKMIAMMKQAKCDAILFSHYHGDHVGLLGEVPEYDVTGRRIQLGLGLEARKVLIRINKTLSGDFNENAAEHRKLLEVLKDRSRWIDYKNKDSFQIGDFTITTVRVDHSAYDAYMFILEAEGKIIVHTGDYRTHGRLGKKLFPDLDEALGDKQVDILLTEGTMLERENEPVMTEEELEEEAYKLLAKPENKHAFLVCSSTNVESLASFHNAAMRLGRPFVVNYYVMEQLKAYGKSAGKEDFRLKFQKAYPFEKRGEPNPKLGGLTQEEFMEEKGFLMLIGKSEHYKSRMEYFKERNPLLIYSMWEGYVNFEEYPDTYDKAYGELLKSWRHEKLHTSGHATVKDIKEMISRVSPQQGIVPIHTTNGEKFKELGIENPILIVPDGHEIVVG